MPTLLISLILLTSLSQSKYYTCDSDGHACKVGTTCCKRKGNDYGCCPISHGICCGDDDGHCCPQGYPICDVAHKRCTNHLQLSQPIHVKSESLNLKNTTEFLVGLASGLGVRLDQYASCTQELSVTLSLFQQVFKYLQGSTVLDRYILIERVGETLKHVSTAAFNCDGAFETSVNFVQEFFDGVQNKYDLAWMVLANLMNQGNFVARELDGILLASWREKGAKVGRMMNYVFRLR